MTPQIAKQLNLKSDSQGLVVTNIETNGPAAEAGISRGDVILEIDRQPVSSIADIREALDAAGDEAVVLLVASHGRTVYLTVKPE